MKATHSMIRQYEGEKLKAAILEREKQIARSEFHKKIGSL